MQTKIPTLTTGVPYLCEIQSDLIPAPLQISKCEHSVNRTSSNFSGKAHDENCIDYNIMLVATKGHVQELLLREF